MNEKDTHSEHHQTGKLNILHEGELEVLSH